MSRTRRKRAHRTVQKTSGESQPFSEKKLIRSLMDAGATRAQARRVSAILADQDGPPQSTRKLYRTAFSLLRREGRHLAARYSLKRALLSMGPSGFPFERLVGELLKRQGYEVEFNQSLRGRCISHEVDVVATRFGQRVLVECKYHRAPQKKNDVKVALYVQARAQDLLSAAGRGQRQEFRLITNTRFTAEAIAFAECTGLKLIGWDYPKNGGLRDLITAYRLHPITCLTGLNRREKDTLLNQNIVSCHELLEQPEWLDKLGKGERQKEKVLDEIAALVKDGTGR